MQYPTFLSLTALAASLLVTGCAPQPRQVPFNESAFTGYGGSGSGTISGTAYTVTKGGNEKVAYTNATVKLMPANAYTEEIVTRHFHNRTKLEPADPRFQKYVRRTHPSDDSGHFVFTHVPAGTYYVSCHLRWSYPSTYMDNDGIVQNTDIDQDQWIYAKVTVGSGQTARVENWVQGK